MNSEAMVKLLRAALAKYISFKCVYIKIKRCSVEQEGNSLLLKFVHDMLQEYRNMRETLCH